MVKSDSINTALVITLMMIVGIFARMYGLGVWDYYADEIWHVYVDQQATIADVFYTNLTMDGHPILSYLLQHYALMIWDDPWAARAPSLIAGILTIPAGYFLGKEMFGSRNGGLFAAFFMAFSGLLIEQSDLVRGYALCMLFSTIALWSMFVYGRTHRMSMLLIYFIAMMLAFLSEWATIALAPFAGLYLLYSIYRKPSTAAWTAYILIHLVLVGYLVWFQHELSTIGMLKWDASAKGPHQYPVILENLVYFLEFIARTGFSIHLLQDPSMESLYAINYLINICILIAGIAFMVRQRLKTALSFTVITTITIILLNYAGMIPMNSIRRNICYFFPLMALYYYACCYVIHYALRSKTIRIHRPLTCAAMITILLGVFYGISGTEWRKYNSYEFQQTRAQTKEIFTYLDAHTQQGDIIVTDWLSYLFFWKYHKSCPNNLLSSEVTLYSCYKNVPVYMSEFDYRTVHVLFDMYSMQKMLANLNFLGSLKNIKRVWFLSIQHADFRMDIISPPFIKGLTMTAKMKRWKKNSDLISAISDGEAFMHFAYKNANPQKVELFDGCTQEGEFLKKAEKCTIRLAIMALPISDLNKWFINHPPYLDTYTFLQNKLSENPGKEN